MTLNSNLTPSGNFDLANWKITLPSDQSGSFSGTAYEVKNLTGYQHSQYFYTANDGAMVFNAPVDGATTSGSKYARSELREMNGTAKAAWNLAQGGTMTATLEVDKVPTKSDGSAGRVVVGQIHGQEEELVRLYWEKGSVYFVNDRAGANNTETKFTLTNAQGQTPDVSLDEKFSYTIDAYGDDLKVNVYADGQVYTSNTRISDVWDTDTFYFKAGTYLGVNETSGTGEGQTSFYALSFKHDGKPAQVPAQNQPVETKPQPNTPTTPVDPTPKPDTPTDPVETPPKPDTNQPVPMPTPIKTINGTNSSNVLSGKSGADEIFGHGGNDRLYGKNGNDILTGGSGKDAFVFDTKPKGTTNIDIITDFDVKDDSIYLNDTAFTKLKAGNLASSRFVIGSEAEDSKDFIIYNKDTGALFYDADGSNTNFDAVQFAQLQPNLKLTASDFFVI